MIDLDRLEAYRENNRIEAKLALGGLPHSIWETYSAFANTFGGILLLGVEEHRDKSLHSVDLPDPAALVRRFWALLNDPKKASANVLTDRDVRIETVRGNRIVVIEVPPAPRHLRPVYVDGDPVSGTYRRGGEGDYRCTEAERLAMYRDAALMTQDMLVLDEVRCDVLSDSTLRDYRARLAHERPGHALLALEDSPLLRQLGAAAEGRDGAVHPTAAGLLMFGTAAAIRSHYPRFSLCYREGEDAHTALTTGEDGWIGNLFDFYFGVSSRLWRLVCPEKLPGIDNRRLFLALQEALANCLINADYYGRQGVTVFKKRQRLTFTNPGTFRVSVSAARSGGLSDPRNGAVMKMFNLIGVGAGRGGGVAGICHTWRQLGWAEPSIRQLISPDRTVLSLPLGPGTSAEAPEDGTLRAAGLREAVVAYLTDHASASAAVLADALGLTPRQTRTLLRQMADEGIVTVEGPNRSRRWRLRA